MHHLLEGGIQAYLDQNFALTLDGGYHESLNVDVKGYKAGIGLKLCTAEGLAERHVARRDGPAYKACRKLGWGDGLMAEQLTEFDQ